jgi:hypothetical protein
MLRCLAVGSVPKINQSAVPFVQRESICAYLSACKSKGMRETDLFVMGDLYEASNQRWWWFFCP